MIRLDRVNGLASIQDLGRQGQGHLGIPSGGAMDSFSLILANRLLGNEDNAPAIELASGSYEFTFETPSWVALCGATFEARIESEIKGKADGRPLWHGWRGRVNPGEHLTIKGPRQGVWGYLAVLGGIEVPEVLGGHGTFQPGQFGGYQGRQLASGDILNLSPHAEANFSRPVGAVHRANDGILRALPGPEMSQFNDQDRKAFWHGHWTVSPQNDRMGARLTGESLDSAKHLSLRSHAVLPGVVQVPPGGQPIVLQANAQTSGGYPRMAMVIEADRWKLAQARAGQAIRFQHVSPNQVEDANLEWQHYFYRLARAMDGS
ncbi:biotin-dependent carboxyltransferase family protein [Shewanella aegiceratis]|uniref:5-oxoprolinase subunit C family protein n=1 Tax=Shewanella aegiceratis TaxID=2864203 RepID=UPI001C659B3B|nr:biotin-dependent carboxyltransferase family protein [Shewanella aegiceratis]QYJ82473.1 biotin-dependent carboxyltransferase family protein [Shewanella aegiceratis]